MRKRPILSESELYRLYNEQGLSQREIGEKKGLHRRTIGRLMQKLGIAVSDQTKIEVERACENCGQRTTNPKFCSISCAASYNNQHFPKRKKQTREWVCVECGKPTTERRKYCDGCAPNHFDWMDKTISELARDTHSQVYRVVRALARRIYMESGKPLECAVCKYSYHIEICHIRAISSFNKNTFIREVNRLDNLVALCPNHHWELDNGRLALPKGG